MIAETSSVVEILAEERALELVVHCDPVVPEQLDGDKARIQQIIMNLLSNAIKFASEKGGIVVFISGEQGNDCFNLTISVADTGIGIPAERHKAIFEAFQQADGSTTRKYGGTGLGLTICRRLLDLMGGDIWVTSKVGIGTRFTFSVPCGVPKQALVPPTKQDEEKALELLWSELPNLSILLADDHIVNRSALTRLLSRKGHTVSTVATGNEVLTALEGQTFDLILMDLQMPDMGGDRATEIIRASGRQWNNVPIIALTANAFYSERKRLLTLGMNAFVAKPVEQKELVRALASCIKERSN
jgi:CheY-like chemotaxis protein